MSLTLTFDEVIAFVGQRPQLRLLAIDGLPLAGKTTLADRLAAAIGGACIYRRTASAGTGRGTIAPASVRISIAWCAWIGR